MTSDNGPLGQVKRMRSPFDHWLRDGIIDKFQESLVPYMRHSMGASYSSNQDFSERHTTSFRPYCLSSVAGTELCWVCEALVLFSKRQCANTLPMCIAFTRRRLPQRCSQKLHSGAT